MLLTFLAAVFFAVAPAPPVADADAPARETPPQVVQIVPVQPNSVSASDDPNKVYALALRPTSRTLEMISAALNKLPMLSTLMLLVGIDILMGSAVAFTQKRVSSTVSWRGMVRKAATFLIVGMAAAIEPFAGLPLAKLMCIFFVYTEAISIVEAAAGLGVPLPPQLLAALIKLRDSDKTLLVVPVAPVPVAPAQMAGVTINTKGPVSIRPSAGVNGMSQRIDISGAGDTSAASDATDRNTEAVKANTAAQEATTAAAV